MILRRSSSHAEISKPNTKMATSFTSLTPFSMGDSSEISGDHLDETPRRRSTRKRKSTEKSQAFSATPKRQKLTSAPSSSWRSSPPVWQSSPAGTTTTNMTNAMTQTITPPTNKHDTRHKPANLNLKHKDKQDTVSASVEDDSLRRSSRKKRPTEKVGTPESLKTRKYHRQPSLSIHASPVREDSTSSIIVGPITEVDIDIKVVSHKHKHTIPASVEDDSLRRSLRKKKPTEKVESPESFKPRPYHRHPSLSIHASPVREASMSSVVVDPISEGNVDVNVVSQDSLLAEESCAEATKYAYTSTSTSEQQQTGTRLSPPTSGSANLHLLWTAGELTDDEIDQICAKIQDHDAWPFPPGGCDNNPSLRRWYIRQISSAVIRHKIPCYSDASTQMEFFSCIAELCTESLPFSISSAVAKANSEMRVEWKIREEEEIAKQERADRKKAKQRLDAAKKMHSKMNDDAGEGHGGDESEGAIMKSIIDAMQQKVEAVNQAGRTDDMRLARKKWLGFVTTFLADAETVLNELEGFDKQPIGLPSPENSQDA
ncbi:hypothetical protein PV10_01463 [Exophiala mesophila]|uniref:Uncharacterized protein n=1 Tax=Exophiala mesophila TaxID=212818 RepID=A0A0D2AFR9_EXOME|nr:uncharacterized protein PV10_01463 [Exophiala mesophila]KIV97753.1 hypothetical protein PV10_01463 [Exophiala mesophila]